MPSVSILCRVVCVGEGGGVCSYAKRPLLLGLSAKDTFFVIDGARGRDGNVGVGEMEACDRLIFLDGGDDCGGEALETEGR